uniref:DUF3782 domain-containing protein n=1 Tax=Candidatus Kentrum sp. SD TaxID=2126332 RepID=A0A451BJU9_9GAMM|nr:MAG: hypothetical protein BECKSD772F_GA0070984_100450 [Candidatus Kentron sp. SD]VFK40285.1 MAG: hypothetical protein BECKSD772E_GA0070983_100550 [Candidatus Kentron sp. SD]VFK78565.1 MAG: hypothetical protein BECKSD772D_GA0070982_101810 [Candidatus Kentron sp. SD]
MNIQEPTPESVWAFIQEIARRQAETDRQMKETDRQIQETDRQMQKTDQKMQETDRKMQETDRQMKETDRKIQETDRQMQETDRKMQETDQKIQETDRQMKETDRLIKENAKQMRETERFVKETIKETAKQMQETDRRLKKAEDLFTTQWGRLMESLVSGSLIRIFNGQEIPVDDISTRIKGSRQGHSYEFDIIVHNGREIIIVEVKTTLRPDDVREFLEKLKNAKTWMPRYQDNIVYGAMAWLQTNAGAEKMAANKGLFSIRAVGDSGSLANSANFKPRKF